MTTPDAHSGEGRPGRRLVSAVGIPVAGTGTVVGLWWAAVAVFDVPAYLAPTPPAVAAQLARMRGPLLTNALVTLTEAVAGFGLAVATAVALGILLAVSGHFERALRPTLLILTAIPKPVIAPLLIAVGGFGPGPKIVLVWLMCMFPIAQATTRGLTATPADLIELARSLTASRAQTFVKIRLPAAIPHIFTGLKTALPLALIGATVAELFGAVAGLGYLILNAGTDTALAGAAAAVLAGMSITLNHLLTTAERHLTPWIRHTHA